MLNEPPPVILVIAGSDSSGGAGIQADLRTIAALGCYGTSAITALTAQNTTGVHDVHPTPPDFIEQQIHSVLDDIEIHAIKTGMLFDAENARATARALRSHYANTKLPPLVCDPVSVSTSGHSLLHPDAVKVVIEEIFPISTLITPNKSEAELLLSHRGRDVAIQTLEDMIAAASDLSQFGPPAVLLKGGHISTTLNDVKRMQETFPHMHVVYDGILGDNMEILQVGNTQSIQSHLVVDVLHQGDTRVTAFVRPHIDSKNTHGTGCTLSTALACALGRGISMMEAVHSATAYTHLGIDTAYQIGRGHGPLNHLHSVTLSSIPRPTRSDAYPFTRFLIQRTGKIWKQYVEHDFVRLLGQGILPRNSFVRFVKQDYHYLKYYARAHGLLASKSMKYGAIQSSAEIILSIIREIGTHKTFCKQFGISEEELEATPQASATIAYGSYIIDIGLQGDTAKLLIALLACLLGYGEVGLWLKKEAQRSQSWVQLDGNPYLTWIEDYSGVDYQNAVQRGLGTVEELARTDPPSPLRLQEWCEIWERCTWLEKCFWDMAMETDTSTG